jgi:hemerythrin
MPRYAMPSAPAPEGRAPQVCSAIASQDHPGGHAPSAISRLLDDEALWGWGPELELGIPVIDRQHQRFVRLVGELRRAVADHDHQAVGDLIEGLGTLTQEHFATEEKLMEIGYYPFLEEHRRSHRHFTERLLDYQRRHLAGAEIARELLTELQVYLSSHMRHEDALFVPYVLAIAKQSWLARLCDALFPIHPTEQ